MQKTPSKSQTLILLLITPIALAITAIWWTSQGVTYLSKKALDTINEWIER